jgi:hypothetical protein
MLPTPPGSPDGSYEKTRLSIASPERERYESSLRVSRYALAFTLPFDIARLIHVVWKEKLAWSNVAFPFFSTLRFS